MGLHSHCKVGQLATKGQKERKEIKHGPAVPKLLASGGDLCVCVPRCRRPHGEKAAISLPARWPRWIPNQESSRDEGTHPSHPD